MNRILMPMALLAAGFPAAAAFPHAFLDHAVPAVGATVTTAPKEVQIFYTQAIEPAFSAATSMQAGDPSPAGSAKKAATSSS